MGSDLSRVHSPRWPCRFMSRSRMGSDLGRKIKREAHYRFQFTLPHGERRGVIDHLPPKPGFNSRSRMGSDSRVPRGTPASVCFNSRSRMGSDSAHRAAGERTAAFQFTLPHGERPPRSSLRSIARCFNSRSRMGSDPSPATPVSFPGCFNSRSRMGSDTRPAFARAGGVGFQFTLPHGERQAVTPMAWRR